MKITRTLTKSGGSIFFTVPKLYWEYLGAEIGSVVAIDTTITKEGTKQVIITVEPKNESQNTETSN